MKADLLRAIESPDTSAQVNVVSGYKQFINVLELLPEVKALDREVRTKEDSVALLLRMFTLVGAAHDPAYETPYDVALACYLWVLSSVNPEIARVGAELVRSCHGCWWSRKLAEKLLAARGGSPRKRASGTVLTETAPVKAGVSHSADQGGIYIDFGFVAEGPRRLGAEMAAPWSWRPMSLGDLLPSKSSTRNIGTGPQPIEGPARNEGTGDELQIFEVVA
jgi:hypothetical protein